MARYKRRKPVVLTLGAWFCVNEGSITVVCSGPNTHQARLTRRQLLDALHAMRKRGKGVEYVRC